MADQWFAARVHSGQEHEVTKRIAARLGFPSYAPRFTGALDAPVFPMYSFIQFDIECEHWPRINDERGVIRLLPMHRPHPVPIPERLMEECRTREDAGEFVIRGGRLMLKYRPGDDVPITHGAYRGLTGKWIKQDRSIAWLAMRIFGALRDVSVPVEFVTP